MGSQHAAVAQRACTGTKERDDDGFIDRALLGLVADVRKTQAMLDRTRVAIDVIAKERGLDVEAIARLQPAE
jgi:hypothetical protein